MRWYRNRYAWVAVILLAFSTGAAVLVNTGGAKADLPDELQARMRTVLEKSDPGQHNHAGHGVQPAASGAAQPPVICGARVYGYEPAGVTTLAEVRTVYGFHLCGVAERDRPWDVAVKLAGPVILDVSQDPPGIQVVEATADVSFADRLRQMFPAQYLELAQKEALTDAEMADLRSRYDDASGT